MAKPGLLPERSSKQNLQHSLRDSIHQELYERWLLFIHVRAKRQQPGLLKRLQKTLLHSE